MQLGKVGVANSKAGVVNNANNYSGSKVNLAHKIDGVRRMAAAIEGKELRHA